jgi:PKD repeat protein
VTLDGEGHPSQVHDFPLSGQLVRPGMDLEFGPDGALYLIEWGSGFDGGNADSGIYRIDHVVPHENSPPAIDSLTATPSSGFAPLEVDFTVDASDPDGDELTYQWELGDGDASSDQNPSHTYAEPGSYEVTLTVSDGDDEVSESVTVLVNESTQVAPDLRLSGRPAVRRVGPQQNETKFHFRVANSGDAASGPVSLCVNAPRKRLELAGERCIIRNIPAGQSGGRKAKLRVKPPARGKVTGVRLIARGPNVTTRRTTVQVRAK